MPKTLTIATIGSGAISVHLFVFIDIGISAKTFVIVEIEVTLISNIQLIFFVQFNI